MSQSATPATHNDMTTCLETFEKERFCSFPQRHSDATAKPETRDETSGRSKTSISCETSHFRHVIKQVGMSQSATPATHNDMTTCLETFEKERFCSFPHRHGINYPTTPTRRRPDETLEANKDPAPRPPDYKREPFATHLGIKVGSSDWIISGQRNVW